jgi:hypothetical protein
MLCVERFEGGSAPRRLHATICCMLTQSRRRGKVVVGNVVVKYEGTKEGSDRKFAQRDRATEQAESP